MTTAIAKPTTRPARNASAEDPQIIREITHLCGELSTALRTSVDRAMRIGLRLLILHRDSRGETGGFITALERIEDFQVPRSTAYRWINAAGKVLAQLQNICDDHGDFDPTELVIPSAGSEEFVEAETALAAMAARTSIRRLMLGSAATGEESRLDALITLSENGDPLADEILEKVAKGELTLVQAIRARAGAAATRNKERNDPCYLDIDGATGEARGLFVRSIITMSNTFDKWDTLDETARMKAKTAWKALVAKIPKDLR